MSLGRRTFPGKATVTIEAGGQRLVLTGREAAMLAALALAWQRVAAVRFGTVCFEVTPDTAELWITQKDPKVKVE